MLDGGGGRVAPILCLLQGRGGVGLCPLALARGLECQVKDGVEWGGVGRLIASNCTSTLT